MSDLRGKELAYATLNYIEAHPEEWDQRVWICETKACFAGTACLLAGAQRLEGTIIHPNLFFDGKCQQVLDLARYLLGLTPAGSSKLFWEYNTLPDLRDHVLEIYGPRDE